jgi:hypothetical protein
LEDFRQFLQYRFWGSVLPDLFCCFAAEAEVRKTGPEGTVDHSCRDGIVKHGLFRVAKDYLDQILQGDFFTPGGGGVDA